MKQLKSKETIGDYVAVLNLRIIVFCCLLGILNSFFFGNQALMLGLCLIEIAILFYDFFRKNYEAYLCHYLVFLCFSMESATFVGTNQFYGFKNFRIAGLNVAIWMLLPLILMAIINWGFIKRRIGRLQRTIINSLAIFTLSGFLMGIITYLADDNGFSSQSGSFGVFIDAYYTYLLPFLELLAVSWVVCYVGRTKKIKQYLYASIIAMAVVFLACFIMGNYGNRGGLASLQVSDLYFLLVTALVLAVYPNFKRTNKVLLCVSALVILVLSLMFNASGKIVITTVLIPVLMLIIVKRQGYAAKTILAIVFASVCVIIVATVFLPKLAQNNLLLSTKLNQATAMFSFSGGNWLENMASSPKMRITEFMNIGAEYFRKPWYAFWGKGFAGTIKDNLNLFDDLTEFSFSKWELNLGAFYTMHESINCFFLVGGICGLICIVRILGGLYKNIHKSPWLLFGFFWILLFYNYHMTIAIYGIVSLVVGLYDLKPNIEDYGQELNYEKKSI